MEDKIEEYMLKDERAGLQSRPTGGYHRYDFCLDRPAAGITDFICKSTDIDLSGLKVVHDETNGSASLLGPEILERLGAEVIAIHNKPGNGINIHRKLWFYQPRQPEETVLKYGCRHRYCQ